MSPQTVTPLNIDSVAFGGSGVARHDGKVYFVANTVPGDVVSARVTDAKERYAHAEAVEFLTESPLRGKSPCAFSSRCGGCQWLGISYEDQLRWKLGFVTSAIKRIGRLDATDVGISGSPSSLNYRNRIHLKAQWHNTLQIGYFGERSHDLVAIDRCMIADNKINHVLPSLVDAAPKADTPLNFRLEIQEIPVSDSKTVLITIHPNEKYPPESLRPLVDAWQKLPFVAWAGFIFEAKNAPYFFFEEDLGIRFHTKPGLFQQVNLDGNRLLRSYIFEKVMATNPKRVLDLYCGSGNFSLPLAKTGISVEGSEYSKTSIECAKHNAQVNGIATANYHSDDSVTHAWRLARNSSRFSHVIVDPPRDGMIDAVNPLLSINAENIVYISCDPSTLARDLGKLCQKQYRIQTLRAFDFFPNTYHVESAVHLVRQ